MKWQGRRKSSNVQDARGRRSQGGLGGGRGMMGLLFTIGRTFGIKGILVILIGGAILWKLGIIDPSMLTGGGANPAMSSKISPEDQERFDFVSVVLADTEDIWKKEFARTGRTYELPTMEIYRGQTRTACGTGNAAMGPFYCPADKTIYIDLSFYDELAKTFEAPGDFAQAYVIAHEVGHHVQNLLGTAAQVHAKRGQADYNQWSVRLELQADYYAGVWTHHNEKYLEKGDIQEAMQAANAIGDDAIQKKMQGKVVPHAFTHGTSAQRMRWFNKGLQSGDYTQDNTFALPYDQL